MRIVPVQGKDCLYPANEVVRLGEKRLLHSEDDWTFLSQYMLVMNPNWARFLAEQRRAAESTEDIITLQHKCAGGGDRYAGDWPWRQ